MGEHEADVGVELKAPAHDERQATRARHLLQGADAQPAFPVPVIVPSGELAHGVVGVRRQRRERRDPQSPWWRCRTIYSDPSQKDRADEPSSVTP